MPGRTDFEARQGRAPGAIPLAVHLGVNMTGIEGSLTPTSAAPPPGVRTARIPVSEALHWALLAALCRARCVGGGRFAGVPDKPRWQATLRELPLPERRYAIFFTPRSGSSRLTDILEQAGGLGAPGECFNPRLMGRMARFLGAQNLPDYLDLMLRRRATDGTFGCELTVEHLYANFFSSRRFFELYRPTSILFLIREDIVAQAVSLSRMNQTGVAHRVDNTVIGRKTQADFRYRPAQIRHFLKRILWMEAWLERLFARRDLQPLRLSYESLVREDAAQFVALIAEHVGARPATLHDLRSRHRKLGDARSGEFAARFADEHPRLLRAVAARRCATLAALEQRQRMPADSA